MKLDRKSPNRTYTEDFKANAIQLANDLGPFVAAGKQLGIAPSNIRGWKNAMSKQQNVKIKAAEVVDQKEHQRRVRENKRLQMEVEIQKKATAYFATDHLK